MIKFFDKCPACSGPLIITKCRCADCGLEMRGQFRPPHFAALSDDQLTFIRIFMRARGNLSEVEKVLGISYPTIRNKLDEINRALDSAEAAAPAQEVESESETDPDPAEATRRAILQQVAAGQISAVEATDKLRIISGGK